MGAGEVNDQDNPLMPHGNWDMYDIEEVCEPECTVKYTRHRSMVRYGDNNWILKNDDLIPTGIDRFTQGAAIGIDRCKVACAARPKCKAIAMGHPTRGTAAECWLAGEVNDQDNPLMPHGNWDMYDIEEVCEPECTVKYTRHRSMVRYGDN